MAYKAITKNGENSHTPTFKLEKFEGPLDLLLFLIARHKLSIIDIPITLLLEQYLDYMEKISKYDMEIAGEFLEMAARLIYIKTVSLLPKTNESEILKKELEGRLIELSLCKKAAAMLSEMYSNNVFVRKPMKINADSTYTTIHDSTVLLKTYIGMNAKSADKMPVEASAFNHIVMKRIVSVSTKILYVLRKLYTVGTVMLDTIYDGMSDKSERVATFLAVLELTKAGRISISNDNLNITIERRRGEDASDES